MIGLGEFALLLCVTFVVVDLDHVIMNLQFVFGVVALFGAVLSSRIIFAAEAVPEPFFNDVVFETVTFQVGAWEETEPQVTEEGQGVTFQARGLPKGLSCDAITGVISGVPLRPGKSKVTITGTDQDGNKTVTRVDMNVEGFPAEWVDEYHGLIDTDAGELKIRGFVRLNVAAQGALSGKLILGFQEFRLRGSLVKREDDGPFKAEIVLQSDLTLSIETSMDGLTCILERDESSDEPWQSVFGALRRTYDKKHPATWAKGVFTVYSSPPGQDQPHDDHPVGDCIYSLTVSTDGRALLKGVLADGSAVIWSSVVLGEEPTRVLLPIYLPLYKVRKVSTGLLMGHLSVYTESAEWDPESPPETGVQDYLGGHLIWEKAAAASDRERLYPGGFSMELFTLGHPYQRPRSGTLLLNAPVGNLNAALSFYTEGLADIEQWFTITRTNGIKMPIPDPESPVSKISLSVNARTGFFSGSCAVKEGRRTCKFRGIIIQPSSAQGRGYGHFLLPDLPETGGTKLPLIRSGAMSWMALVSGGPGGGGPGSGPSDWQPPVDNPPTNP